MSIVTKESNPELYNSLFEDSTIEDAKKVMQNMFNDITPEQFEEYWIEEDNGWKSYYRKNYKKILKDFNKLVKDNYRIEKVGE